VLDAGLLDGLLDTIGVGLGGGVTVRGLERNRTRPGVSQLTSLRADRHDLSVTPGRVAPRFGWQVASAADGTTPIAGAGTITEARYLSSGGEVIVTATGQMRSTDAVPVVVPRFTGTRATTATSQHTAGLRFRAQQLILGHLTGAPRLRQRRPALPESTCPGLRAHLKEQS
jgi:hypothetical protein